MPTPNSAPISDLANALRFLSIDAVEVAKSGHPGMPMGMAEIAVALWQRHLKHYPGHPRWHDRDRFVLSNGHGSMLQYALLHLTGYDLPMEELKNFRQMHSRTPGHPEVDVTPGVETTTGPLGQGIANAVGMALAEKMLAVRFNRSGHTIVDHHTYVFLGDGCLMEGVSHEVCSLAGTWKLGKLIALYDDNGISIDGDVRGWMTDDTPKRFEAYGWQVIGDVDGHDVDAVDAAIRAAQRETEKPTLICCKTVIGKGAPTKGGTADTHGAPLGEKEIAATRAALGWAHAPFEIPPSVYQAWDARAQGAKREAEWTQRFEAYRAAYPDLAYEFIRRMEKELPADFEQVTAAFIAAQNSKAETVSTRKASQQAIEAIAPHLPEFLGGSADLTGSVFTNWSGSRALTPDGQGDHIHYGVREFAMLAIANGVALHGGFIPYGGTFLTFSDYARNALRMAALMKQRVISVFTHDSIGLGEDGPTHQSIEHASSLRLIPNMDVWRPCDTVETAVAWQQALLRGDGPSCLLFTRQNVPFAARDDKALSAISRGGYVLADFPVEGKTEGKKVVMIATGSEVALALQAREALAKEGVAVRVVSMPCTSRFDQQDAAYRAQVLPPGVSRMAMEAGTTHFWHRYVGALDDTQSAVIGIDTFGESAPAPVLFKHFGFSVENVVKKAKSLLN
ncbi:MAG: transketolase [Proteobacteria bacterium]|nr:transketolase [Pseudomonadota bacterium]MCL2307362.1 transketolase [Pseudomonadota bacterium]